VSTPEALAGIDTGAFDPVLLETAIAEGAVLIIPERPIAVAGSDRTGAWIVDLVTGATRDVLDDGSGGFSIIVRPGGRHGSVVERSILNDLAAFVSRMFNRLTDRLLRCIVLAAYTLIGAAAAGKAAGKAAGGAADAVGGVAGAAAGVGGAAGVGSGFC
jgi:hypothetical protein